MNVIILAKGSGSKPYEVEFIADGNSLVVFCNCHAGSFGKLCKHKTELLAGDRTRLFGETEISKFEELQKVVRGTPELTQLLQDIAESELTAKTDKAKLKNSKNRLETALKQGIPIEQQ